MELGMIGLGRMGANMTETAGARRPSGDQLRSQRRGDSTGRRQGRASAPIRSPTSSSSLTPPRAIWLMVPSGDPVDQTIEQLLPTLAKGRYHHRRRQLQLQRFDPPRREAQRAGHSLRRRRHQRRHLGLGERLLHDGRRRKRDRRAARADLQDAGAARTAICTSDRAAPAISSR